MQPLVRKFKLGEVIGADETRHLEFKEVKGSNPVDAISKTAEQYAVAYLNAEGGRILWGVEDVSGRVVGVRLSSQDRDDLRREVMVRLNDIEPFVPPSKYRLELHAITIRNEISDLYVVELVVDRGDASEAYFTGRGQAWVRADGIKVNLQGQKLVGWLRERSEKSAVLLDEQSDASTRALLLRVRHVFAAHGLESAHLPRFFRELNAPFTIALADTVSDGTWLRWLDEAKLNWLAATFGLRREWLDGEDAAIHHWLHFDKDPALFWETICDHVPPATAPNRIWLPEAYFIRDGDGKGWTSRGQFNVYVVLAIPLLQISSERIVFRYLTDFTPYPWGYARTRIQLRAWARLLCLGRRFVIKGYETSARDAEKLASNSVFLRDMLEDCTNVRPVDWHPDDYALSATESVVAKDTDSLPQVLEFLREHGLPTHFEQAAPTNIGE